MYKGVGLHIDGRDMSPTNILGGQSCPYQYLCQLFHILWSEVILDKSDTPSYRLHNYCLAVVSEAWKALRERAANTRFYLPRPTELDRESLINTKKCLALC